jgi:hypothetical protein
MNNNPSPPSERQLAYAKKLNISIPPDATMEDVGCLIELTLSKDKPSSARHRAFAEFFNIRVPALIGKKSLFDLIQFTLSQGTRDHDLMAWFSYRVYRQLTNADDNVPISGPGDATIQKVASMLAADPKVVKSARRYSGAELIYFGEWTAPDGATYSGGSKNTAAYKATEAVLRSELGIARQPKPALPRIVEATSISKPKRRVSGCLWSIVKLVVIAFLLLVATIVVISIRSTK